MPIHIHYINDETERLLLANDPSVTSVSLQVLASSSDTPIALDVPRVIAALTQSTHVQCLIMTLDWFENEFLNGVVSGVLEQILQWIVSTPALESLRFGASDSRTTGVLLFPVFVEVILSRNQRTDSSKLVSKVALLNLDVKADDLATLMRASGLTNLTVHGCTLLLGSFPTEAAAIQHVAQSFAENASISDIALDVTDSNSDFFFAMLTVLHSKTNVTGLTIANHISGQQEWLLISVITALEDLFNKAVCPLKFIKFDEFKWTQASMAPICRSLRTSSMPLGTLTFDGGSMDVASCKLLQSIYRKTIPSLCIVGAVQFPPDNNHEALQRLVGGRASTRTRDNTDVMCELSIYDFEEPERQAQFQAILRGLTFYKCNVRLLRLYDSFLRCSVGGVD
jgi:D-ribose pyranose/furanose isomerase RbsD